MMHEEKNLEHYQRCLLDVDNRNIRQQSDLSLFVTLNHWMTFNLAELSTG